MIPDTLQHLTVPIAGLVPFPGNARRGDLDLIKRSLEHHGQFRPVVVNRRGNVILAGNHTVRAARDLGWTMIAVTYVDVDDAQARRIALVDNRSNDTATYDVEALAELLQATIDDGGLVGTGYEDVDIDALLAELGGGSDEGDADRDTEPGPLPAEPRTQPGDLITLGRHQLLCGDSFDPATLERLYGDADIGCVLTDPPYGINLDTNYSTMESRLTKPPGEGRGRAYRPVTGDDKPLDATPLAAFFDNVREQFWFGANYYRRTLSPSDLDGSWLVWDKRSESSDAGFGSGFELIWSRAPHKQDLLRHYFFGAFGPDARNRAHPTQKPVPLLTNILDRWAPKECVVADPFAGSGSTLIACENTGRSCYAIELDPAYCDVIADRWATHTGLDPERG